MKVTQIAFVTRFSSAVELILTCLAGGFPTGAPGHLMMYTVGCATYQSHNKTIQPKIYGMANSGTHMKIKSGLTSKLTGANGTAMAGVDSRATPTPRTWPFGKES